MSSNDEYWARREALEKQWMADNLKNDEAYAKHINGYYDKMLSNIQDRINDQYTKYAGKQGLTMAEAKGAVSTADQVAYAKEAKDAVAEAQKLFKQNGSVSYADFSQELNDHMKLYNATMRINRLEYLKAQIGLEATKAGVKVGVDMSNKVTEDYLAEVKRQAALLGNYLPPKELTDYRAAFKTVMNSGNPNGFSDVLWKNTDAMKAQLDMALTQQLVQGLNPRTIARDLRKHLKDAVANGKYASERLARTESARAQTKAQNDCYTDLGVKEVRWIAEPSACKLCADIAADNEGIYKLDDVPTIPAHPNCRCSMAPHADRDEMNKLIDAANADTSAAGLNDGLAKTFGDDDAAELTQRLRNAPARMQKMWAKYQDRFVIDEYKTNSGSFYSPKTQMVTTSPDAVHAANRSSYLGKYDVVYHEFGHAIDHFAVGKDNLYEKISHKNGLAIEMSTDFMDYRDGLIPDIRSQYTKDSAEQLWGGYYIDNQKVTFTKKGELSLPSARKLAEQQIGKEIRSKNDWPTYGDVSDMVEAATSGRVSPGIGHGKSYWKYTGMQSTEAFAEMTSATINNPKSLEQIKKIFPNAYKKYLSIVDAIIKAE